MIPYVPWSKLGQSLPSSSGVINPWTGTLGNTRCQDSHDGVDDRSTCTSFDPGTHGSTWIGHIVCIKDRDFMKSSQRAKEYKQENVGSCLVIIIEWVWVDVDVWFQQGNPDWECYIFLDTSTTCIDSCTTKRGTPKSGLPFWGAFRCQAQQEDDLKMICGRAVALSSKMLLLHALALGWLTQCSVTDTFWNCCCISLYEVLRY